MSWTRTNAFGFDGSTWEEQVAMPRAQLASSVCLVSESDEGVALDERPLATFAQSADLSPAWRRRVECRKRKGLDGDEFDTPLSKQLITEDAVAAQLGSLYLDGQNSSCMAHGNEMWDNEDSPMNNVVIIEDRHEDSGSESDYGSSDEAPAVELSKELKEHMISCTKLAILPEKLVEQISRPCMELVVWRPPADFVQHMYSTVTDEQDMNRQETNNSSETRKIDFIDIDAGETLWESDEMEI
ncbi:uncharacterized protein LOC134189707 isoform X2 [Corticium candelabrum]|uniref:uncharacterized protein LOC134189707 isoform X2 n=1 Tax=Corticium candelabrum TaxID=121492 RepID=UPI002E270605|nr:uncharacterized protein LOC134189707 isoform X2 [Corticium candelabrum]